MCFKCFTPNKLKLLFGELPGFFLTSEYLASHYLDLVGVPKSEEFESVYIP